MEKDKRATEHYYAVSLYEPMVFWLLLLYLGLIVKLVLVNLGSIRDIPYAFPILSAFYTFVLSTPGFIVLPLIAGAIIGAEVGVNSRNIKSALRGGILNSIYAAAIYFIAIVILYEVNNYTFPFAAVSVSSIIATWIVMPVILLLAVTELFAMLSNARKIGVNR